MATLFCGIDWGESRHDVAIIDQAGTVVSRTKITADAAGFTELLNLLAAAGDTADCPIPVALETDRGLLVAALRGTGREVYPLNPLAASRYRARHQVSGAKSDAADAVLLANILRTDMDAHRPLPADTELAQAIRVLARAQQDAVWSRQKLGNQIRSLLKDFYPAAVEAFASMPNGGLARPEPRTILAAAPTPAKAAKLTRAKLRALLIKAGRQRRIDAEVDRLLTVFRSDELRQPAIVEEAMGMQLTTLLAQFEAACQASDDLEAAAREHFESHPDAAVIGSFPGMGTLVGARVLAEIGDDRQRFADARGLKAFAGSAPITRASGKRTVITYRRIKNNRLASAGSIWALAALKASPGARRHFQTRRERGDWSQQAQRRLFNKFLGQLHHCLQTGTSYDETHAFPPPLDLAA
ncbi:IS110 family transposase [Mycobacteroides abscessus]|uniref:IS110 family transposase n=1 Tax=Mycobacteroides abscessus TaxID=36809 RepID=UPI0005DAA511|nr:IS110 family transposase [Mycobacteroides abscessus]MDO3022566.1 IS110 family transposase [Mycobacteroides abscessus subsp. abscessus]CPV68997.1 transposase IS116/IS110/IS902 [Mycobacteroides abscessus]SID17409.1 transposase IS116/IS110/IS902 [Mycobacteroides abscessus subsp. abscessus]SII48187.1 transposase IS116/IS110/IS902 [Mycobacteroides abscessus subsp. abscessus]SII91522.1 transposase IS116/IS110/IS902 [Mycobacteroides abscessus subsp. abscessus]